MGPAPKEGEADRRRAAIEVEPLEFELQHMLSHIKVLGQRRRIWVEEVALAKRRAHAARDACVKRDVFSAFTALLRERGQRRAREESEQQEDEGRRWINAQLTSELCGKFLTQEKRQQFRERLDGDDPLALQQVTEAFQAAQWLHTRWKAGSSSETTELAKAPRAFGSARKATPTRASAGPRTPSSALSTGLDILQSPAALISWYNEKGS